MSNSSGLAKMHPDNLFVDKVVVSGEFLKERETQIILSPADSPDRPAAQSPRTIRAESIRNVVRVLTASQRNKLYESTLSF
jgi:hypothetical protein